MKIHKSVLFGAVVLVALLGFGEAAARLALRFVPEHVYYRPPSDSDLEVYRARTKKENFSRTLGWIPKQEHLTAEGYRKTPHGIGRKKVASVYGDSFAFGEDVGDNEVWTDVLSGLLGGRVENYGVPFYGTGQALLRFMENSSDKPEVVILVMMSENIARNVNQNCTFMYSSEILFRPIWHLEGNGIALEPFPDIAGMDAATYGRRERELLRYEYFWPESSALAKRRIAPPYLFYLPRAIFMNRRITAGLLDEMGIHVAPFYAELYDPKHPSGAYELTLRIFEKFVSVARLRGIRRPIVLFLPRDRDINYFRATGRWGFENFWAEAKRRCPEFYTLSDNITRDFRSQPNPIIKEYFHTPRLKLGRAQRETGGHYSVKGNAYLAEMMRRIVQTHREGF